MTEAHAEDRNLARQGADRVLGDARIARLAPGLQAVATSPDGLVEGVERAEEGEGAGDQFLLGVQWHPEDLVEVDPRMRRLFDAFIAAANGGQRPR